MIREEVNSLRRAITDITNSFGAVELAMSEANRFMTAFVAALPSRDDVIESVIAELRATASPEARAALPLDDPQFIRDSFEKLERLNPDDGYLDTAAKLLTILDPYNH